jgi:hypothetical protein
LYNIATGVILIEEEIMSKDIDEVTELGELEIKIKESKRLLQTTKGSEVFGFWPLVIALGIVVSMGMKIPRGGLPYILLTLAAFAYVCFNIWRIYWNHKKVEQYEAELKKYEERKVEIQA